MQAQFLAILVVGASGAALAEERPVYQWLLCQQQATGLLGNQEGETFAGVYPNALAAVCFLHEGDIRRAEQVLDFFDRQWPAEFAKGTPGGFHQFWDAASGDVHADTDRWVGDNAWLLIALNYYRHRADRMRYDRLRGEIARWLISLQDEDGGVWSGFNKDGPMRSKSTEANLDCYAALVDHPAAREKIRRWLRDKMWIAEEQRFRMGTTVSESALDCSAWGVAALGREYASTLAYAERTFGRRDVTEVNGRTVWGFADFIDKRRIWWEGTGEMAVAYHVGGQRERAEQVLRELRAAMLSSRQRPGTCGLPCASSDPAWAGATTKIFVPSQAWYLFGVWEFNPMQNHAQGIHTH